MTDKKLPRPTDGELGILRVLWGLGPATVREVHEALQQGGGGGGYTTTLKLMQIMAEKGLVERDESERAHVYRARATQERTQRQLMAMQALSSRRTSPKELAEIRRLLDSLDGQDGGKR